MRWMKSARISTAWKTFLRQNNFKSEYHLVRQCNVATVATMACGKRYFDWTTAVVWWPCFQTWWTSDLAVTIPKWRKERLANEAKLMNLCFWGEEEFVWPVVNANQSSFLLNWKFCTIDWNGTWLNCHPPHTATERKNWEIKLGNYPTLFRWSRSWWNETFYCTKIQNFSPVSD